MAKFSIVIPVYNVEKYVGKCLDSIVNQTFKDYEIIVVNDGSTDGSIDIVRNYNVKIINSEHLSVSEARNIGAKEATGEYLIFLDSDDYWSNELLEKINNNLSNSPDLVRFQVRIVTDNNESIDYNEETFNNLNGKEAFDKIVRFHYIESIWCYAIKRSYYNKNKFAFAKGKVHEDFGLTPLIVIKANTVNSIDYIGYNYYKRSGSIMNTKNYEWIKTKVKDFYYHYLFLTKEIESLNIDKSIFKSYISNSLLLKICELKGKDYREYRKKIIDDKVIDNLLDNTIPRKIKKILFRISPKLTKLIIK